MNMETAFQEQSERATEPRIIRRLEDLEGVNEEYIIKVRDQTGLFKRKASGPSNGEVEIEILARMNKRTIGSFSYSFNTAGALNKKMVRCILYHNNLNFGGYDCVDKLLKSRGL